MMWKCRWNTVCPDTAPLNCITVSASGLSAARTARATRWTPRIRFESTSGSSSSRLRAAECLGITRVWARPAKDVHEGEDVLVLEHTRGRHFTAQDLGEDVAVVVGPVQAHRALPRPRPW